MLPADGHDSAGDVDHGLDELAKLPFSKPAQVAEPEWSHRSDVDPAAGRATRQAVFGELADTGTLLAFGHFPRGADLGHVRHDAGGWAWRPIDGGD